MGEFCQEVYFSCFAPAAMSFDDAVAKLKAAYMRQLEQLHLEENAIILQRFFCSDVHTQAPLLQVSWPLGVAGQRLYIGQIPLDSAYVSLQVYAIRNASIQQMDNGDLLVRHGGYVSFWTMRYPDLPGNAEIQSDAVIDSLNCSLHAQDLDLKQNVIRTWYYVRDIDNNYSGMIRSRVRHYEAAGLRPDTHFIASTGIEASAPNPHDLVSLHSHAISGLEQKQITYLKALDFLSPTHAYGVNFERATRIEYGDRLHCHISGTASIDAKGEVVHTGDVVRQCIRAIRNIEALLNEGGMEMRHLRAATVYLRDGHDYHRLRPILSEALPADCACVVTHAPVCRPDWLVEIEGEAIAPTSTPYPTFV